MYINYTMPDKKISEFNTFTGVTGSDVFFVIASGEAGNTNAKNYRVPFDVLYSDLGLDAGGGGAVVGGDSDNIDFGGTTPGDTRSINFQQGGENVMVIGSDGNLNVKNDLVVSGGGSFTTLNISEDIISEGSIAGDIISGKTGIFTESLTISGVPVSTGAGGTVGGKDVVGGDSENIDFGGTEPGDVRNINFQQGGENVMVINEGGDVSMQNDLYVSGGISGDIISGKTGVFTESLTVSGVSVITGNQQPSIQWLEDIGGGELTLKEEQVNGVNFFYSKWHNSLITSEDIYYNDGKVGVNNEDPQAELDVSGDIYSNRVKIGGFTLYTDANGNLVFDS